MLWQSLHHAAAMLWEMLWALILGFTISGCMQAFVSREKMAGWFGRAGLKQVLMAMGIGAASSSCSYAAAATMKTAFRKGAAFVPAVAFLFASTNLVIELGIVLWMLMGWRFLLAEVVGSFILVGVMWILASLTLPSHWVDAAREHAQEGGGGHHHHHHQHGDEEAPLREKLARRENWGRAGDAFVMDVAMLWKEILAGVLIAGFVMVLVPGSWWQTLFLSGDGQHAGALQLIENALVGPLIAMASFVCSVGNIPLAGLLWSSGISFGGAVAFIYADLIVIPLLAAYRRYYGLRMAAYLGGILFVSMVVAGIVVDLLFAATGLIPDVSQAHPAIAQAGFSWNYTTWLNVVFIPWAVCLFVAHRRRRARR